MRETPRSQGTASDSRQGPPQFQPGRAFAHTTGASSSGNPHRSDGRPPHTPRGARYTDPALRSGTTPPDPERRASLISPRALCVALLAVFALITWQVAADGPLRRLDESLDRHLAGHGSPWLTNLLSDFGSPKVAVPVLLTCMAYAAWRGSRAEVLAAGLTMAVTPALVVPIKIWTDRPGPLTTDTGYFPSGHTATAMVAYFGAAMVLSPYLKGIWRTAAMAAAGLLTTATAIGLLLHGYHWPLDVLGSLCLCGALLVISSSCTRRSSSRTPDC
ncbi:phosphatase PAP2 family protein [Streptomyces beijiangensis]|uniref:Phosphatase PAP2 family protein n=1 Tax=Streptomyces beijiangensis TaxID=163361 RepID=A0A939JLX4_9ACTN|nr:phosphatase PAP2 family protein [Streptomyces beijiangensis]MBO0516184.1 phosphatase PAP2 family protein [Streptomyces beijiangensis]